MTQKIESALGNGQYAGYVKLDTTKHFTLEDPDNSTIYGASGKAALAVNGSAFIPSNTINIGVGWYYMTADVNAKTYTLTPYMVGLVGAFDNWAAPDSKMEYNPKLGVWSITTALPAGDIKFRLNDDWDGILRNPSQSDPWRSQYYTCSCWYVRHYIGNYSSRSCWF